MRIAIINGPNLNLVGTREPEVYGNRGIGEYLDGLAAELASQGVELTCFQSNHEGAIIDELQRVGRGPQAVDGIVLNAGAYTHTSLAIADAIRAIGSPVIEVHISNIHAREAVRHTSLIAGACCGSIAGFGLDSYRLAASAIMNIARTTD